MTQEQVNGVLRAIAPAVLAFLAAKGLVVADATAELIITALGGLVAAAWSVWSNRPARKPLGG